MAGIRPTGPSCYCSGGRRGPHAPNWTANALVPTAVGSTLSVGNWRLTESVVRFVLLPKLDVAGSSPAARSLAELRHTPVVSILVSKPSAHTWQNEAGSPAASRAPPLVSNNLPDLPAPLVTPGKRVGCNSPRGFESRPIRSRRAGSCGAAIAYGDRRRW